MNIARRYSRLFCTLLLSTLLSACANINSVALLPGPTPVISTNQAVINLFNEAEAHSNAQRYANARASLERALRLEPANARLWFEIAKVNKQDNRKGEASNMALRAKSLTQNTRLKSQIDRFIKSL